MYKKSELTERFIKHLIKEIRINKHKISKVGGLPQFIKNCESEFMFRNKCNSLGDK
jgi:hypothetical protein